MGVNETGSASPWSVGVVMEELPSYIRFPFEEKMTDIQEDKQEKEIP